MYSTLLINRCPLLYSRPLEIVNLGAELNTHCKATPQKLATFYHLLLWVWLLWITYIDGIIQYFSFCDWFISLMIVSSFNYSVTYDRVSFPFKVEYVCISHTFFIHSPVSGHLVGFHLLSVVNNAAINMRLLVSSLDPDFISCNRYLELRLQGNIVVHIFNFLRKHHTAFSTAHSNLHSHWQCRRVSFLHTLLTELTFICLFDDSYSGTLKRRWLRQAH